MQGGTRLFPLQEACLKEPWPTSSSTNPSANSPLLISAKTGPDEPLFDPPLHPDTLVLVSTSLVQSPFSGHPSAHYMRRIPVLSIQLQTETAGVEDYSLQLVDLSVPAYPATVVKALKRREGDVWIRTKAGSREIDLRDVIRDYESVAGHTVRLVLLARDRKRRLLETLLRFGLRDWQNRMQIKSDLERFREFIKTKRPHQPSRKRGFKATFALRTEAEGPYFPVLNTMKTVTPRRLQAFTPTPTHQCIAEVSLPYLNLSPLRCRKGQEETTLTRSLLLYSKDETEYQARSYDRGRLRAALLLETLATESTLRDKEMLVAGQSSVFSKACKA